MVMCLTITIATKYGSSKSGLWEMDEQCLKMPCHNLRSELRLDRYLGW